MRLLFSFQGEIGRSNWWLGECVTFALFVLGIMFGGAGILLLFPIAVWVHFAICAKRFREHGFSPWLTLLWLIPWFGWLSHIILCGFLPSEKHRNLRYYFE